MLVLWLFDTIEICLDWHNILLSMNMFGHFPTKLELEGCVDFRMQSVIFLV